MQKTRILFCTLHRPDRSPSQRFRFEQYIGYLGENGFDCRHLFILDQKDDKKFYAPGSYAGKLLILARSIIRLLKASSGKSYDIVFVQREAFMLGTTFFERRFGKKAKLVFDFDDSIWLQNVSEGNKRLAFLKNPEKTAELIRMSALVLAGNEYLAEYARKLNNNVKIVPTTIDTEEYSPAPKSGSDAICIGWSGSKTTIRHFAHAIPALKILKEKYGKRISITVIGDGDYRNEELGIEGLPWKKETEIADLGRIDIGIMPLPDDEWSRGKCGLKGLQYMALEIPAVMSPVGVNSEIVTDGVNGMLASSTDEWVEKLSALIENSELRRKIGKAGRATVVNDFSVPAWRDEYLKLLRSLV